MSVTLKTLIDETSDYVKVDLDDDDGTTTQARIISALNEAKNIVAKRIRLTASENITLDEDSCFDVADLTSTFWKLVTAKYSDAYVYTQEQNGVIWCDAPAYGTVTVEYQYIPDDMALVTDAYPFNDSVSWRLLCYYAAAQYFLVKGTSSSFDKYRLWNNKWEDGVEALRAGSKMAHRKVKATYSPGGYYGFI